MSFPNHSNHFTILMILLLKAIQYLPFVSAGICWYKMETQGYCKETLQYRVSKENCCKYADANTAYSPSELRDDIIFFLRAFDKGVPCAPCKETCEGVKCGKNKKCILKNGHPKCVCSLKCKDMHYKRGPVCGTDSKSYKSVCRLRKQRCRNKMPTLKVNYRGFCQKSCKNVKCRRGKYCVQDQYLNAHCVSCNSTCNNTDHAKVPVCGDNGVTYESICHLESASCYSGRTVTVAYRNKCKTNATCNTINCSYGEKCLMHQATRLPRCVPCMNCTEYKENLGGSSLLCGKNNQTYQSWCDMINDSCTKGYVIEAQSAGSCELKKSLNYAVLYEN